jgi:hypothetical protein
VVDTYRKAIASNVWHFCSNCTTWPGEDYIASLNPEQIGYEELCTECVARHDIGDCQDYDYNYDDLSLSGERKCPVTVDGKKCGHDLLPDSAARIHMCSVGHHILIVLPAHSKKTT